MTDAESRAPLLRAALAGALSLVFPTWCVGCDAPDTVLCDPCRRLLHPDVAVRVVDGLPVYSGLVFDGVPARTVRACKEEGRTALARALAPALAAAAAAALADADPGPVAVVPVPTSPAAMRRRGYRVVELIADRADLHPQRLLRATRTAADQRGLRRTDRERNVRGSMRIGALGALGALDGRRMLVVDDVVTTGATLREAARVLEATGARVVAAATVASTPRKGR